MKTIKAYIEEDYNYVPKEYLDEFMNLVPSTVTDPEEIKNLADMFMKMKGDK